MGDEIIKSKIIFATLILFILISLTCVSAADINKTDDVFKESDTVTEMLADDVVGNLNSEISHVETEIDNAPESSIPENFTAFQSVITNASGNYILLDKNYTYNDTSDSLYKDGVVITQSNLVIDGNGYTLNGSNQARVFIIEGNNVTLKNINFISGRVSGDGGAVYFAHDGTVINCYFENNGANLVGGTNIEGGAVRIEANGTLIGCVFINNFAEYGGGVGIGNNGTLINCTFSDNKARLSGGGAFITGFANVENCRFFDNDVTMEGSPQGALTGGALNLVRYSLVNNCYFEGNKVKTGSIFFLFNKNIF